MYDSLLVQKCSIMKQVEVTDEWSADTETLIPVFSNVPCRFDSLILSGMGINPAPAALAGRGGGLLFLPGKYGHGSQRLFDEKNVVRLEGYDYTIEAIHDIFGMNSLDHYEVVLVRGINR